jgi:hypothetical protein
MPVVATLLWLCSPVVAGEQAAGPSSDSETCGITFIGQASGGTLMLCDTLNRNARCAVVETVKGEPADRVARRLADAIYDTDAFGWYAMARWSGPPIRFATSSGGTIRGLPGTRDQYIIAGTENGLGIPPAPTCLTCNYSPSAQTVVLRWRNPPGGYDSIDLICNWHNYDERGVRLLPGASETYTLDVQRWPNMASDLDLWLVGRRKGIPSNAAGMHVSNNVQEELFGIPFTNGTAPNWTAWSLEGPDGTKPEMATRETYVPKPKRLYEPISSADRKPYQQMIRATGEAGGTGGVSRTFLGLLPGHTYRITVRLNTVSSTLKDNPDWSCSFHAVACGPGKSILTARQMAGLDALPDGSDGLAAGRVCLYDAHETTRGRYNECVKEITVPEGADSITVWLRFASKKKGGAVAMDNIKLEDLGKQ